MYDIPEDWLRQKYFQEGLSDAKIASVVGCSSTTIYNRRVLFNIFDSERSKQLTEDQKHKTSLALKGHEVSEEVRKKISKANQGKDPWNKGKVGVYSEETRYAMGAGNRGRQLPARSAEHRRNLAKALTGKQASEETRQKLRESHLGHSHREETKRKIGAATRSRWQNPEFRQRQCEQRCGRRHSEETKAKMRDAWGRGAYEGRQCGPQGVSYTGFIMRSTWEARLAQVFDALGWNWEYEPSQFQYELGGEAHTYTPDFYVPHLDCYFDPHAESWDYLPAKYEATRKQCGIRLVVLDASLLDMYEKAVTALEAGGESREGVARRCELAGVVGEASGGRGGSMILSWLSWGGLVIVFVLMVAFYLWARKPRMFPWKNP